MVTGWGSSAQAGLGFLYSASIEVIAKLGFVHITVRAKGRGE